ncbi:hypothetical protein CWT02_1557 [Salmonella enterica subsp. enterica serovar Cubana]|nr:hypothetical protein CWT02_1557 [Salmonella enterica subsp. enterica serovar Cubana]
MEVEQPLSITQLRARMKTVLYITGISFVRRPDRNRRR